MDRIKKPANQPGEQNDNESIQDLTTAICSPEFPNGCTDIEPDESEK